MKMLASIQCIQGIREDPQCGRAKDDPPKRPNEVDTKRVREAAKVETMDKDGKKIEVDKFLKPFDLK